MKSNQAAGHGPGPTVLAAAAPPAQQHCGRSRLVRPSALLSQASARQVRLSDDRQTNRQTEWHCVKPLLLRRGLNEWTNRRKVRYGW